MNDSNDNAQDAAVEAELAKELNQLSNDEILDVYIDSLLLEKWQGEEDIEEEVFADLRSDLVERFDAKMNENLVDALPGDKVVELDEMIERDEATPEAVRSLLSQSGVDASELTKRTMEEFREEYLAEGDKAEA